MLFFILRTYHLIPIGVVFFFLLANGDVCHTLVSSIYIIVYSFIFIKFLIIFHLFVIIHNYYSLSVCSFIDCWTACLFHWCFLYLKFVGLNRSRRRRMLVWCRSGIGQWGKSYITRMLRLIGFDAVTVDGQFQWRHQWSSRTNVTQWYECLHYVRWFQWGVQCRIQSCIYQKSVSNETHFLRGIRIGNVQEIFCFVFCML